MPTDDQTYAHEFDALAAAARRLKGQADAAVAAAEASGVPLSPTRAAAVADVLALDTQVAAVSDWMRPESRAARETVDQNPESQKSMLARAEAELEAWQAKLGARAQTQAASLLAHRNAVVTVIATAAVAPPPRPAPPPTVGGVQMRWVCEFCYAMSAAPALPSSWELVLQSAVCRDCQERVAAGGGYGVVRGGSYADGPDPRGR